MTELSLLMFSAASIAFFHTLVGPDHYLPFVVMARVGRWSLRRTLLITFLCGLGHVLSSVLLGLIGVGLGVALSRLVSLETVRGGLAAWALIAFGLLYGVWGLRRAYQGHPHLHSPPGSSDPVVSPVEASQAAAPLTPLTPLAPLTPWLLFTIFVLGPCEPLIPLLMYPAAKHSWVGVLAVTAIFGLITLVTMLAAVFLAFSGLRSLSFGRFERFSHAIAGATLALSGLALQILGL